MEIEINKIKPDPNQPRKTFDEIKLKEMSETFKTQGTISPIEIDENNIIVTGELRWRASKLAGLKTIPCKILKGLTKEARLERQLVENFNRQDMRLVDSIEAIKDFVKHLTRLVKEGKLNLPKNCPKGDYLINETAKRLGTSRKWLFQNLELEREAPKELKEAVKEGKVSVSTATEIMKLPDKEEREDFTKELLEQAEIPEHRKIRERVQEKKEKIRAEKELEELRKVSSAKEIKITTDRDRAFQLRDEIIETQNHFNRLMSNVRWARKKKFFFQKPKQKDDFIKFLDASSIKARKWADELDDLKEEISIEIIKE